MSSDQSDDLRCDPAYAEAVAAEDEGQLRDSLRRYHSLASARPRCVRLREDVDRVVGALYGVRGSDGTVSAWQKAPLLSAATPPLLQYRAHTRLGRVLYFHGGYDHLDDGEVPHDCLWAFSIDRRTWAHVHPGGTSSPGPRSGHTLFASGGRLYLWGGIGPRSVLAPPQLWRLDVVGEGVGGWSVVKCRSQVPPRRSEHAGVVYGGKLYIAGGLGPDSTRIPMKDAWVLNLSNFKWAPLRDMPCGRHCHNMFAANGKIFVLGGRMCATENPDITNRMEVCGSTFDNMVSYNIATKTWAEEIMVGSDRPFSLSEFTVLPIHANDGEATKDEPSSILVWGGYSTHVIANKNEPTLSVSEAKARYGDGYRDYGLPYRRMLLRFDPGTNVFKNLVPLNAILPKAQSFAAHVKSENGNLHLLIGQGYGSIPAGENEEVPGCRAGFTNMQTPVASNMLYEVRVTESFGDGTSKSIAWSHDINNLPLNKTPGAKLDLSPWSPTLHLMTDLVIDDFITPVCSEVLPNNESSLLGVRVLLHGLISRPDLNGQIGRCGWWMQDKGRYQVFMGATKMSIKPTNLNIAQPIGPENLSRETSMPKEFVNVIMSIITNTKSPHLQRPILDDIINPPPHEARSKEIRPITDTYHGPVSPAAQVLLRSICNSAASGPGTMSCILHTQHSPQHSRGTDMKNFELYSRFVKSQWDRDTIRAKSFKTELTGIDPASVKEACGTWLKLKIQVDGVTPCVEREVIVRPKLTMRALHNQIICPALSWRTNYHCYAFRKIPFGPNYQPEEDLITVNKLKSLKESCWIGPKVSTAIDAMFMPLYIGGFLLSDSNIELGEMFTSNNNDTMYLQYVHDFGDFWSHTITVTKFDKEAPVDAGAAYLIGGQGGNIPQDIEGLMGYSRLFAQLAGHMAVDNVGYIDPSKEQWWVHFNSNIRSKPNLDPSLCSNLLQFDLQKTRMSITTALHQSFEKAGKENLNSESFDFRTGLTHTNEKKVTAPLPKDATKLCAVCGVTAALSLCSRCNCVAYCSREHQLEHWPIHKADCKRKAKKKKRTAQAGRKEVEPCQAMI